VSAFQRSFVKEIRRCDEMERQLRTPPPRKLLLLLSLFDREGFFEAQCRKFDIPVNELPDELDMPQTWAPTAHEIDVLEENCKTNEQRLNQLLESKQILERRHAELVEFRHVLRETAHFFEVVRPPSTRCTQLQYCPCSVRLTG